MVTEVQADRTWMVSTWRGARRTAPGFILPVAILGVWHLASLQTPTYILPSPADVGRTLIDFLFGGLQNSAFSGSFWIHLTASVQRVAFGYALGMAVAIPLGLLLGASRTLAVLVEPTLGMLRAIPGIAWLPLALVWFGIGLGSAGFLIFLGSFWPILLNTTQGVRHVDPVIIRAARMLGVQGFGLLWRVMLPAAFPSILTGLRLGLGYSWIYMVLGEFTGVNNGLGATLLLARDALQTSLIISLMIVIGLIGFITDLPMQWLLKKLVHTDAR